MVLHFVKGILINYLFFDDADDDDDTDVADDEYAIFLFPVYPNILFNFFAVFFHVLRALFSLDVLLNGRPSRVLSRGITNSSSSTTKLS